MLTLLVTEKSYYQIAIDVLKFKINFYFARSHFILHLRIFDCFLSFFWYAVTLLNEMQLRTLGAVRDGGFIPWDDDLDLAFTAADLKRLSDIFPKESQLYTITFDDTWVARIVPREPISGNPAVDPAGQHRRHRYRTKRFENECGVHQGSSR